MKTGITHSAKWCTLCLPFFQYLFFHCKFIISISVSVCRCKSKVEAKHSAPKCYKCDLSKVTYDGGPLPKQWSVKTNFDKFIEDISLKFQDSFFFVKASLEGRHGSDKFTLT